MIPKTIGIVGGAGPLAGAALLERVIALAGSIYGCYKDADFPKIILLSFPFSEMLAPEMNVTVLQKELSECLAQLRQNGAAVLAIACNTLHVFLEDEKNSDLIYLPRAVAAEIPPLQIPLVLCTSTSRQFALHKRFFPCMYPDNQTQHQVDRLITQILKGADQRAILRELEQIIGAQSASTIILGCTELSLFTRQLPTYCNKLIIDPLEIVAKKILENSFSGN